MSQYECKTLYQAAAATGYLITLSQAKKFVSVLAQGGTYFIKPYSADEQQTVVPTDPTPAAEGQNGWYYLTDAQELSFGSDSIEGVRQSYGVGGATIQIAVWCIGTGTLSVVSQ